MDTVKTKKPKKLYQHKMVPLVLLFAIFIIVIVNRATFFEAKIDRQGLMLSKVQQGSLDITVQGYGKLASNHLQLITASSNAIVKEIKLKPGAIVTENSVIAVLENDDLTQLYFIAQQELVRIKANERQLKLNQKRELLYEEGAITELKAIFQTAKLTRIAHEKLVEQGVVSALTYKESLLHEQQLKTRISILSERRNQLLQVHIEALNIANEELKQQQGRLALAKRKLNQLEVKAGFNGVLQRVAIRVGQNLKTGQEIALMGSSTDLIAKIRIPQNQAQTVALGQKVYVNIRQHIIEGSVARIDPIVAQNTVEVEVALPKEQLANARPQQNIDATIVTKRLQSVLYIERPLNVTNNNEHPLFKLDTNNKLQRVLVKLGHKNNRFIEIKSGLLLGDNVVISDLTNYTETNLTMI